MNYGKARWSRRALGLSLLALVAAMLGCVEEVGLIDRTQPNKVPKELFQGVWYNVTTVVDIPPQTGFSFIGETYTGPNLSTASKVVWDITETHLIVYPVSELIEGSEKPYVEKRKIRNYWKSDEDGEIVDEFVEMYTGQPIAAFPIESHFDVQRTYSAATGEESNVVEENTTDRKWWERKYIRVNWAKNDIADFGFITRAIDSTGVDYYVQDWEVDNPDRPMLTEDAIMITTKIFAQPQSFWACEAIQGSAYAADEDCAGAVIKVRNAFEKVDPNNDFVPQRYHVNLEQDKFGYFLTERHSYDERFGTTNEGKISLIQRWNIWEKSRDVTIAWDGATDANDGVKHLALETCLEDADCTGLVDDESGAAGNHCWLDAWFEEGHCVRWEIRPVHERGTQPIIYHLSAVWPEPLRNEAYQLAEEYDVAYKDTVAWATYWSERGMLHPKTCSTNDDCNTDGELLDFDFEDNIKQFPCTDQECTRLSNTTCDASGWCAFYDPCSEQDPCNQGQTCETADLGGTVGEANVCHAGGAPALVPDLRPEALTFVLYKEGDENKTIQLTGEALRAVDALGNANIRFLNASPGSGAAQLELVDFSDNAAQAVGQPAAFNANVRNLPFSEVDGGGAELVRHLVVRVGGAEAAKRTFVRLKPGHSYLVVFAGGNHVFAVEHRMSSAHEGGIRVVHAMGGEGKIDVALNAALRGNGLELGDATEWMAGRKPTGNSGNWLANHKPDQRLTVVRQGGNNNVTCYYYDGVGQCVGWKPVWGGAEQARFDEIRANVDHMYVVCDNVYSGDTCDFDGNGNPADPTVMNDCRYSKLVDGVIVNPCKDRVPDYDREKLHGDIRYNFLYWIPEEQAASPLGYGPSAGDAHTGEIFYGIAHVYGAPMETYGTYARDLIWLVNGVKDDGTTPFGEEDIVSSRYIREYVDSMKQHGEYDSIAGGLETDEEPADAADRMATRELDAPLPQALQAAMATAAPPVGHSVRLPPEVQRKIMLDDVALQRGLRAGQRFPADDPGRARLDRIKGTWIEDLMINDEVAWAFTGQNPADAALDRDKMSPLSWMTLEARDREQDRILNLARHNVMVADFVDESLFNLAKKLGCDQADETPTEDLYDSDLGNGKCLEGQNLRWGVMARIFGGTLEHEVGHTVGLRHNFTGSADPMNFQDEYFQIREREIVGCANITVEEGGNGPDSYCEVGEQCDITLECTNDAHCPNGTTCKYMTPGATRGKCVDTWDRTWGVCSANLMVSSSCTTAADCGADTKTNICSAGVCRERLACDAQTPCEEGQLCDAAQGLCTDAAGQPVERVAETERLVPVRKLVPRPAPTARETELNRMEYQYSSLMDYGGGINFDMHGLGKYDRAALLFGYGELVEVWKDTTGFDAFLQAYADKYSDNGGFFKDTSYWKYAGVLSHPFSYLNDIVGIDKNLQRIAAPWRQVNLERAMVTKDYVRDAADVSWIEVPYKFCSDEYRGQMTMGGCYYFDLGADIGEIVYHSLEKLREYYVFDAFKREAYGRNMGGNPNGYFARILDRWLRPLGDTGMYLGLYSGYFNLLSPAYLDYYRHSTYNMWALDQAGRVSLQALTEMIASPAPGTYVLDEETNQWVNVAYTSKAPTELKANEAAVPFGMGKFPYTTFLDEGYWRYDHALWIGAFWEKMAALLTLTDSSANFLSDYVGEQLNVGVGTSVGFNTLYSALMGNFLGGLVAGAPEYTDGTIDPATRQYRTRNVLNAKSYGDDTPIVPNSVNDLTMKVYAAVYGLSFMPAGFDPSFIDSLAITIKGSGSQYDIGDSVETVEFTDPFGHKTYVALRPKYDQDIQDNGPSMVSPYDGQERLDVAARLVEDAQAANAEYQVAEGAEKQRWAVIIKQKVELLDLLRTLNEIYGDIVY